MSEAPIVYAPMMESIREIWPLAAAELIKPPPSVGLTLWPMFTEITGGFRPREFSILCGSTGTGKTTLLANLSANLLIQQVPHYVASVETGHTDFVKRVLSALTQEDLNAGEAIDTKRVSEVYQRNAHLLESNNLILGLKDNRISCEELLRDLEHAHQEYGCKIALLDNLNFFLEVTSYQNERIEMDKVTHELIMFCKRIDMHVVMVMHPRKTDASSGNPRVESEFDIRGSALAVQEAHNVFLFNRPTNEDHINGYPRHECRELKVAKLRRRGKYVGKRLMFRNINSSYAEMGIL